jgi:hypothetical protein
MYIKSAIVLIYQCYELLGVKSRIIWQLNYNQLTDFWVSKKTFHTAVIGLRDVYLNWQPTK